MMSTVDLCDRSLCACNADVLCVSGDKSLRKRKFQEFWDLIMLGPGQEWSYPW